jgi:hypothetical protein
VEQQCSVLRRKVCQLPLLCSGLRGQRGQLLRVGVYAGTCIRVRVCVQERVRACVCSCVHGQVCACVCVQVSE